MKHRTKQRRGFTLVELVVVMSVMAVIGALLSMLLSNLLKAQRQSLLRERQRTEFIRLDGILRSDAHTATQATLPSPTECSLSDTQGNQWTYAQREEGLVRERRKPDAALQREVFYLRPGTKVTFRLVKEQERSLLQLDLDLPMSSNATNARQTPYRGQVLVGGGLRNELRAKPEVQP